jgi:hypothetical protein
LLLRFDWTLACAFQLDAGLRFGFDWTLPLSHESLDIRSH